jgi:hypothetical protein
VRAVGLALTLLLAAVPARGDVDALAQATALYNEGMDLRAGGHADLALDRLRRANSLYATPITGLELGRTYMQLGLLVEAVATLRAVGAAGPRAGESLRASNARAEAAALAVTVDGRAPKLTIDRGGHAVDVRLDGAPVAEPDHVLSVNPGPHALAWESSTRTIALAEGEAKTIELYRHATPPPPIPARGPSRVPEWIGVSLTGASLALGGVSGGIALSNASAASPSCPANRCAPSVGDEVSRAQTWSTVSTVSFVAAGVFGAATLVTWLARPGSKPKDAAPVVGLRF